MNPLLSSQNLFIFRKINPKRPKENDLLVVNEFDGFYNYIEDQMAMKVFGEKQDKNRVARTDYARKVLIEMIGKDEFLRLREVLMQQSENVNNGKWQYRNLEKMEQKVFKLIARGFTLNEIAELLDLTKSKVDSSKKLIYEKLNFMDRSDLMLFATKNNLV